MAPWYYKAIFIQVIIISFIELFPEEVVYLNLYALTSHPKVVEFTVLALKQVLKNAVQSIENQVNQKPLESKINYLL